jgi:hypothetical protein
MGIIVPNTVVVKGRLSDDLKDSEHVWIGVKPYKSIENRWPQTGGPLPVINGYFEGNAFLGGANGDLFEIGILIVDNRLNEKFLDWINQSRSTNRWSPITEMEPKANYTVSKEEIELNKYANITVILNES